MSVVVNRSRRQFLVGTGGFMLALPVLPSLLPRSARAQAAPVRPRFVAMATDHGHVWNSNMYPSDAALTERVSLYSGHDIRRGALTLRSDGARASISACLAASGSLLTERIASKMNVLRGLDIPFYIGHHTGGFLGNYARNDGNGSSGVAAQRDPRPTIDQLMAWSPSFYDDLSGVRERSLHVGRGGQYAISWTYQNPGNKSGNIVSVPTAHSALDLFNRVFVPSSSNEQPSARKPVVDRVLASYKRLRQSASAEGRRLSKADAQRLDDHMDRLAELQRRVSVVASASCGDMPRPEDMQQGDPLLRNPDGMSRWYQAYNDVIAAGIICGTTRIATIHAAETFSPFAGDWHNDVAHRGDEPGNQNLLTNGQQRFFETVFLDLAQKLDIEEADGKTYLDNTLIMWCQESGQITHEPISMPVVTAGSAGGYFTTGNYVDYRNRDNTALRSNDSNATRERFPGILYNQWLANILKAMGIPPSEFERNGEKGYGMHHRDAEYMGDGARAWPDRLFADASNDLPFLRA